MKMQRLIPATPVVLAFLIGIGVSSWAGAVLPPPPAKTLVSDGHVYHDLGNLWNNVTNFGLIGSWAGSAASFSGAPSARWPGENGVDELFAASLWVGAMVNGEPRVTTGAYTFEMQATDAPEDTIYRTTLGAPGGARYPQPFPDDDGDGLEDEDPLNGVDDDGDGLVDEDFGAIGDQEFRCVYSDTAAHIRDIYPDHQPLGISVVQRSFQWDNPQGENFIGYDFTITNVGNQILEDVYLGLFADFDIGEDPGSPHDDMAGLWQGPTLTSDWTYVPIALAYTYDGSAYAGFVFCGSSAHDYCTTNFPEQIHGFQIFDGQTAFDNGGDPADDRERYAALSEEVIDPNTAGQAGDVRTLITVGPFDTLAPGAAVNYRVAMVAAGNLGGLRTAAADAVQISFGQCFDRDGDPGNGDEFHVPWLSSEDIPVAAASGYLQSAYSDGQTVLTITTTLTGTEDLTLIRRPTTALPARRWGNREWTPLGASSEGSRFTVVDDDPGFGPRTYDLVLQTTGRDDLVLDTLTRDGIPAPAMRLQTGPNPFNATLSVEFSVAATGPMTLGVYDFTGRLVQTLYADVHEAGSDRIIWNGRDAAGRPAPSGVYLVRFAAGNRTLTHRVTMVR